MEGSRDCRSLRQLLTLYPQAGGSQLWMLVVSSLSPFYSEQVAVVFPTVKVGLTA